MKQNLIKGGLTLLLAGAAACLRELAAPAVVLCAVMLADYATGMLAAWESKTLSSRTGIRGIVKKLGYIFGVGVAVAVDFVVRTAGERLGLALPDFAAFGLLVTVWLIGNECLSVLENLDELGVPMPDFLRAAAARLKRSAEGRAPAEAPDDAEDDPHAPGL